jgi:hypothetical protein
MVSSLHESVVFLVRDHPVLAAELLKSTSNIEVPTFADAELNDPSFTELRPTEYRSDAMVLFRDKAHHNKPVFGIVLEAQLRTDPRKRFTWPVYVVNARARHECPVVLVVVTTNLETEQWAQKTIELGGGMVYRPFVVGPNQVPAMVGHGAPPELEAVFAVFTALVHSQGDPTIAAEAAIAATRALSVLPDEQKLIYSAMLVDALSDQARKVFEMDLKSRELLKNPNFPTYYRGQAEGQAQGRAAGKAESVVRILEKRGLTLSPEQREQIMKCLDLGQLDVWLDRALTISAIDELFA